MILRIVFGLIGAALAFYGGYDIWRMLQVDEGWSGWHALADTAFAFGGLVFLASAFGRERPECS